MGVKMRIAAAFLALAMTCSAFAAQPSSKSYWFLTKPGDHTWCGYSNQFAFEADAAKLRPGESARATYSSGRLAEVTYQVEPESADWIVIDKYTRIGGDLRLRRANLLAQENLEIIEETLIAKGKARPFRLVRTTTLDGKEVKASHVLDLPSVPVRSTMSAMPFMAVLTEMQSRGIAKLCKTTR
jgi:hypothetical protein